MHQQIRDALRRPLAVALAAGAMSALALSACGGSSGKATAATSANAAIAGTTTHRSGGASTDGTNGNGASGKSATGATGPAGARRRFGNLRECLQRNGVKLPPAGATGRGLFLGGANQPGASRTQLQAAVRKCVGTRGFFANKGGTGAASASAPRFRQALSRFAACLRQNGVKVPAPNTSGNGPVFDTKGLHTSSAQFRAATAKCRSLLRTAFGRPPGAAQALPPGGSPSG